LRIIDFVVESQVPRITDVARLTPDTLAGKLFAISKDCPSDLHTWLRENVGDILIKTASIRIPGEFRLNTLVVPSSLLGLKSRIWHLEIDMCTWVYDIGRIRNPTDAR
jgi:hypothetical protein